MKQATFEEIYLTLYRDGTYRITDEHNNSYTLNKARRAWENNDLDCNLAFARLVENNFDIQAVRDYYNTQQ